MNKDDAITAIAQRTIFTRTEAERYIDSAIRAKISMEMAVEVADQLSASHLGLPDLEHLMRILFPDRKV